MFVWTPSVRNDAAVGWDIGGAHLKAAVVHANHHVSSIQQLACPLWKGLDRVREAVGRVMDQLPVCAVHAVTMTGELADIFETRAQGVSAIVSLMQECLPAKAQLCIYGGDLGFLTPEGAAAKTLAVASANWRASAEAVALGIGNALFVDVGSTTADLVPIAEGQVLARAQTDADRLGCGELVYMGAVRTPIMAIADRVPFAGQWCRLTAEHFATAADVFRLTGELPQHADLHPTADGADKSLQASARRLARMVGRDYVEQGMPAWRGLADYLSECMVSRLYESAAGLLSRGALHDEAPVVGAGVGRFLSRRLAQRLRRPYTDFSALYLSDTSVPDAADCAPAVAVAALALAGTHGP